MSTYFVLCFVIELKFKKIVTSNSLLDKSLYEDDSVSKVDYTCFLLWSSPGTVPLLKESKLCLAHLQVRSSLFEETLEVKILSSSMGGIGV